MGKNKKSKNEKIRGDPESSDFNAEQIRQRLIETDNFVVSLIDTIPPKIYFDHGVQEKLTADKHAIMDQTAETLKRSYPKQAGLSTKNKHKRARLDPSQHKSVSQIQEEIEDDAPKRKKVSFTSAALTRATNVGELQKRLHDKITEIKEKAGRNSETPLQMQKKSQRKLKKLKKKAKEKGNANKIAKIEKKEPTTVAAADPPKNLPPKPVFNKEGKIIYSKFDFGDIDETLSKQKKRKKSGKNKLKTLISVAEKEQEKLETLKSEDKEKSSALMEKKAWQRALQMAEGVKLKDDPTILKKTLKKVEKKKSKSEKAWKSRQEHVDKLKKDRQEKRTKNIKAKKQEKVDKKIKKAKKKGRVIPGF